MPDPTRQSVSASQAAALLNLSPYATRWLLWQHFRDPLTVPLDTRPDKRMLWGRRMQAVILAATAAEFRLDVEENESDLYVRRGVLGCTRDGMMIDPATGPVLVEAKNVDRDVFRRSWTDTAAPAHIEIQVQVGLYAMDATSGLIAVLVGGNDLRWFKRARNPDIIDRLVGETESFFADLVANRVPDISGEPIELPALQALYAAREPEKELDASNDGELGDVLRQYDWARNQRLFAAKVEEQMKVRILARAADNGLIRAKGARARIRSSRPGNQVCSKCGNEIRAASVRTTISVFPDQGPPNFIEDLDRIMG